MAVGGQLLRAATAVLAIAAHLGCESDINTEKLIQDRLRELADPGPPPADTSNKYIGDPKVIALGHKLYFDDDFSGYGTGENILQQQVSDQGRALRGERMKVSCASCHDLDIGGVDPGGDFANRTSVGAGFYDVNSQPVVNAAYNQLVYWNGRNDSLWAQVANVIETRVSMFGSRLRVVWRLADAYRDEYNAAFPDQPIPAIMDSITAQAARINPDGTCVLDAGQCPTDVCHEWEASDGITRCQPRFPLEGLPGFKIPGELWKCDWQTDDPLQPYGDAFDCMDLNDRSTINRIYSNFAKAIAAYEYTLVSIDSDFDRWVRADFPATGLSESAQRGAALFVGKAGCSECHSGPMLTDNKLHNIGIPQIGDFVPDVADCPEGAFCDCVSDDTFEPQFCFPIGARNGLRLLQESTWRRDGNFSDDKECANHRVLHFDPLHVADNPEECDGLVEYYPIPVPRDTVGEWKTPTLRNVALTGPYMHNGMYDTLDEVMEHYNTAASEFAGQINGELDDTIVELNLTDQELADLVAFLETLTGDPLPDEVRTAPEIPPASPFPEISPFAP